MCCRAGPDRVDSHFLDFYAFLGRAFPWLLALSGAALLFLPAPAWSGRLKFWKITAGVVLVVLSIVIRLAPAPPGVEWTPWSPEILEKAAAEKKPVMLDFYADWCVPCHDMERQTYTHPKVIAALEPWIRIKVDLTDMESVESKQIIKRFELEGLPAIAFLDAAGQEIPDSRLDGFVPPLELVMHVQGLKEKTSEAGKETPEDQ